MSLFINSRQTNILSYMMINLEALKSKSDFRLLKIILGVAWNVLIPFHNLKFYSVRVGHGKKLCNSWPSKLQKRENQCVFWPQRRPEVKFEAEIEAGRMNLAQKNPNDLNVTSVTSKHLWRHSVFSWRRPNLCFWKLVCILPYRIELKI